MPTNDARLAQIRSWLTRDLGWRIGRISVASADASFRRYFRVARAEGNGAMQGAGWAPKADTLIVMDAPPGKEDIAPYLRVSSLLEQTGAHVPHVHHADLKRGFIVMEDLGSTQYLSLLSTGRGVDKLYGDALTTLANIQVRGQAASRSLEQYDRIPLARELGLMPEWFLEKHLRLELSPEERGLLTVTNEFLINEALQQPQVFVHRDFHSRNLMVLPSAGPGVIDFQDALRGPIGYDLVSLLKDCYISWSRERVERWVRGYRRVLGNLGANVGDSEYQFLRWFDLIGVQRHVKVLGIFARLWHRDGKIGYLADLPLTFEYVRDACRRYPELVEFERWLDWRVAPHLEPANARETTRAKDKAAKRKVTKRKVAKRKVAKRKVAKGKVAKRNVEKRNVAKRKAATRKLAVRAAVTRKAVKRKPLKRTPTARKAVKLKRVQRVMAKKKTAHAKAKLRQKTKTVRRVAKPRKAKRVRRARARSRRSHK